MSKIKFYNEAGSISFNGRYSENGWNITAAEGLALPEKVFETARYFGTAGQEVTQVLVNARTITLSGDIKIGADFEQRLSRAMSVLNREGVLEITNRGIARRIKARCAGFVKGEKNGCFQMFAVQFVCDDPYFEADSAIEIPIYKVIPKLSAGTQLPGCFSDRIAHSIVSYNGSAETEPIFHIYVGNDPGGILSIENKTSGEGLAFNYEPLSGEFITVDVRKRQIYNSEGENLLKYLADDSFFSGFHLYPGDNEISVQLGENSNDMIVSCRYHERFLEAML